MSFSSVRKIARPLWVRRGTTVVILWTAILFCLVLRAVNTGTSTAPEQISAKKALAASDTMLGDLISAVDATPAVVVIGQMRRVSDDCRITAARSGTRHERTIQVYVAPGGEAGWMSEVVESMSQRYETHLNTAGDQPAFTVMDTSFVELSAVSEEQGVVQISIDTGCRPGDGSIPGLGSAQDAPEATTAAIAALAAVGVRAPSEWTAVRAPCGDGGQVWTVEATATSSAAVGPLSAALGIDAEVVTVVDESTVVAYHLPDVQIVLRQSDGTLSVAATTVCQR